MSYPETTPQDVRSFFEACERQDWTYHFSDDNRAYTAGLQSEQALRHRALESGVLADLYQAFREYGTSMPAVRPAKPVLQDWLHHVQPADLPAGCELSDDPNDIPGQLRLV